MKKTLLPLFIVFMSFSLHADIVYTDYEGGMRIALNENYAYDINGDGTTDFYINGYTDELGFVPVFAVGCVDSPSETAYTSFDAREIKIQQPGEIVQLNSGNLYDYIDDDRGSLYSVSGGFAEGWVDMAAQYIGFALITSSGYLDGWMKVAVDVTTNELIIEEVAYEDDPMVNTNGGGIEVGEKGASDIPTLENISDLTIAPNPVTNLVQLSFDYNGASNLSLAVVNNIGQVVHRTPAAILTNRNVLQINTSDWATGTYFLRLESEEGTRTERIVVAR